MDDFKISGDSRKRQVFISYSHEPPENAKFVRDLTRLLKRAGFDVWLDEERIAGGGDIAAEIRTAIKASDAGLFIANSRWLERDRDWIRHEVMLLGQRQGVRRLLLLREPAEDAQLDPYFAALKRLEWFPDDPKPFARFWEIYCGITGKPPGSEEEWEENGRKVSAGASLGVNVGTERSVKEQLPTTVKLSCSGKPVASFSGDDWTFLITDRDEWIGLRANGEPHPPIKHLGDCTVAAVTATNGLLVSLYDGRIAYLRGQNWEIRNQESQVLCFASGPDGDLAGMASGAIVPLNARSVSVAVRVRDPVVSMASYERGLLVIGSRGMFGTVSWPLATREQLKWIEAGDLGRPLGFFPAVESNCIGVLSDTKAGVIEPEPERWRVCSHSFHEGIREIIFLGAQGWPYAVLTDAGTIVLMDAGLTSTRAVSFPRGATVLGCTAAGWTGTALAWTNEGRLYRISPEGSAERIADQDVVLAYSPIGMNAAHIVRWRSERGATAELMRID